MAHASLSCPELFRLRKTGDGPFFAFFAEGGRLPLDISPVFCGFGLIALGRLLIGSERSKSIERPEILVKKEVSGYKSIFNLTFKHGISKDSEVENELVQIIGKYALTPEGGLYEVLMNTYDGKTVTAVGGIYVQPDKLDAVLIELKARGYEIVKESAA